MTSDPSPSLSALTQESSDADVIIAIRAELWDALDGRDLGGDRTLLGMVKRLRAERDEARDNRRGEYDMRAAAEAQLEALTEERARLRAALVYWRDKKLALDAARPDFTRDQLRELNAAEGRLLAAIDAVDDAALASSSRLDRTKERT